jgi:transposase-like protein
VSKRRKFAPEFKASVVLEMLIEGKRLAQASREYKIKDSVLSRWKAELLERSPQVFEQGVPRDDRDERIQELKRMVGRLAMELEMAKKYPGTCGNHGEEARACDHV